MDFQVSAHTLDGMLEKLAALLTKTDDVKPLQTMDLVEDILGAHPDTIHTGYLEQRVKQLGEQNERQNEEIYRQADQIEKLKQAMGQFVRIIEALREDARGKDTKIKKLQNGMDELQAEVKRLREAFDTRGQVERHTLAECISFLSRYPAERNKEVDKVKNFLFSLYENPTKAEREQLSSLGMKEPAPLVQIDAPVYEVKDNETVTIKNNE